MNGQDWDLCRNRIIARGITEFTDGDIIEEYNRLCREKEEAKEAQDEASGS